MRWAALAWAAWTLAACATARIPRVAGDPPPAFSDGEAERAYQAVLDRYTQSRAVYDHLDTNAFVHATWQSPAFVQARVARDARFHALPADEAAKALALEQARLGDAVEFLLAVHVSASTLDDFDRRDSMWRLALDVGGREVTPTQVVRLGRTNPQLRAIYSYLEPFWVAYRVRFPQVELPPGQPFTFRLASAAGQADLQYTAD